MRIKGYDCVGCEVCYGCGRKNQIAILCDECEGNAIFCYKGKDLCEDCMKEIVNEMWDNFTLTEKIEMLGIDEDDSFEMIEDIDDDD